MAKVSGNIIDLTATVVYQFYSWYKSARSRWRKRKIRGGHDKSGFYEQPKRSSSPDVSGWQTPKSGIKLLKKDDDRMIPSLWPEFSDKGKATPVGRKKCRLLELPFEIREQIFLLVIGGSVLHLVDMEKRVGQISCSRDYGDVKSVFAPPSCSRNCYSDLWRFVSYPSVPIFEYSSNVPSLLRTCRQIYLQGIQILYSRSVLEAEYPETMVNLRHTIRPEYLDSIRSLHVRGRARILRDHTGIERSWEAMWETICYKMKALSNLHVNLSLQLQSRGFESPLWTDESQMHLQKWMATPARNLRNLKHFDLSILTQIAQERILLFQQSFEILVCSSLPKGVSGKFPDLFDEIIERPEIARSSF